MACATFIKENKLLLFTIAGVVIGCALGFGFRPLNLGFHAHAWIKIWGELFLAMLSAVILPLVSSCLVEGISSMDASASGKLGAITMIYIFSTQIIAVILGIVLALSIRPGSSFGDAPPEDSTVSSYSDVFLDFLRNMFPDNIVRMCSQSFYTSINIHFNITTNETTIIRTKELRNSMNILGVVTVSVAVALGIHAAGEKGLPLQQLFQAVHSVTFKILHAILWLTPVGVASLITAAVMEIDDLSAALVSLGYFVLAVVFGSIIHQFIILPVAFLVILRKNPFTFYWQIFDALLLGFSTASSAPPLPLLLERLPTKLDVDNKVADFVLPLAVVFNRDGSAMYVCIAAIFVSQTYGMTLDVGSIFMMGFVTTFLSAAITNVPSASVLMLLMVGSAIRVPVSSRVGLLLAVEWLLDRLRTTNNVASNAYGCALIEHFNNLSFTSCFQTSEERHEPADTDLPADNNGRQNGTSCEC